MKNIYWQYFKYVMEHKKNVFIECWKERLYLHAFTHDMSKFLPCEFIPYAKYFYGEDGVELEKSWSYEAINNGRSCLSNNYLKCKHSFERAWMHHYLHNKHHWDYWMEEYIPHKYLIQMICDWKAMSKKFGDTAQEFYLKNYKDIKLNRNTRLTLEDNLGFRVKCCEYDELRWKTIEEIVKDCLKYKENNPDTFNSKWVYNEYLQEFKDKYKVDLLEVLNLDKELNK